MIKTTASQQPVFCGHPLYLSPLLLLSQFPSSSQTFIIFLLTHFVCLSAIRNITNKFKWEIHAGNFRILWWWWNMASNIFMKFSPSLFPFCPSHTSVHILDDSTWFCLQSAYINVYMVVYKVFDRYVCVCDWKNKKRSGEMKSCLRINCFCRKFNTQKCERGVRERKRLYRWKLISGKCLENIINTILRIESEMEQSDSWFDSLVFGRIPRKNSSTAWKHPYFRCQQHKCVLMLHTQMATLSVPLYLLLVCVCVLGHRTQFALWL